MAGDEGLAPVENMLVVMAGLIEIFPLIEVTVPSAEVNVPLIVVTGELPEADAGAIEADAASVLLTMAPAGRMAVSASAAEADTVDVAVCPEMIGLVPVGA